MFRKDDIYVNFEGHKVVIRKAYRCNGSQFVDYDLIKHGENHFVKSYPSRLLAYLLEGCNYRFVEKDWD